MIYYFMLFLVIYVFRLVCCVLMLMRYVYMVVLVIDVYIICCIVVRELVKLLSWKLEDFLLFLLL